MEDGEALLIDDGMVASMHQHCALLDELLSNAGEEKYTAAVEFDDTNG
jgi:hypothetical protein